MTKSVFLCHSSADNSFATKLGGDLQAAGVRVWLDEAEIRPGDSLIAVIENAIKEMDYFAVVLSPDAVSSRWCQHELHAAQQRELAANRVVVIPVLYRDCITPPFIGTKAWADFRGEGSYGKALRRILDRLEVLDPMTRARAWIKESVRDMGFEYVHSGHPQSLDGFIQVTPARRIGVRIRTGLRHLAMADPDTVALLDKGPNRLGRFAEDGAVTLSVNRDDVFDWQTLGVPVIAVWVSEERSGRPPFALWRHTRFAKPHSGRLKIRRSAVFGGGRCARDLRKLIRFHVGERKVVPLTEPPLYPQRVSDAKLQAWDYYSRWRQEGSRSPVFGDIQVTLRAWRHITQVSSSQQEVLHKLSLLPRARQVLETARTATRLRFVADKPFAGWTRTYHAVRGVYRSPFQADVLVDAVVEVTKREAERVSVTLYSVYERRDR